jgi:transposase
MTTQTKQAERKSAIIDGISRNIKPSEIASKLSVSKWVVIKDIKKMRYQGDPELEQAYKTAKSKKKSTPIAVRDEKRFQEMTGMSLEEKTFINMLHYYKLDLLEIVASEDETLAIQRLPSSSKRCLKKHDIITSGWKDSEINEKVREYLSDQDHQIWKKNESD